MNESVRITGEIPFEYLAKYANWEYALDEENLDGQDETTLRPSENQEYFTSKVDWTVANARYADGKCFHSIVNTAGGDITVYDPNGRWRIYEETKLPRNYYERWSVWSSSIEYPRLWVPDTHDSESPDGWQFISLDRKDVFPLEVETVLRRNKRGKPWRFRVKPTGTSEAILS